MKLDKFYATYSENNIRPVAVYLTEKYKNLKKSHVYWIAKQLDIYPDAIVSPIGNYVKEGATGKINRDNAEFVQKGKLTDTAIKAVEKYIIDEGFEVNKDYTEKKNMENANIWEQVDLITKMKAEYEKVVTERNEAKSDADQYCELADKYEKEIEELKDKLLIAEKENNDLKAEKKELGKMQIDTVNFNQEIDGLQKRIGKYNADINIYSSEVNELRKDVAAMQTSVNRLQDQKKKLEAVISDLIGCSKRLMNLK